MDLFGEGRDHTYRQIVDAASDAVISAGSDGLICSVNPAACRLFGYAANEMLGQPLELIFPESPAASHVAGMRRYVETGEKTVSWSGVEVHGRTKMGADFPVEVSFGTIGVGEKTVITGIVRDLSQRTGADETLRLIQDRFRATMAATGGLVWTTSPDGQFIVEQPYWRRFTGQTFEQYKGWGWMSALHPDDRSAAYKSWNESLALCRPYQLVVRVRRRDGVYRTFSVRGVPVFEKDGSVREWVGTNIDITAARQAEESREFLMSASQLLASSLNFEETIQTIGKLALSKLADWCGIDVLVDGKPVRLASVHSSPAKKELADQLFLYHLHPESDAAPCVALRTGKSVMKSEVDPVVLVAAAHNEEHRAVLDGLGARSVIAVPLKSRATIIGVISFVISESDRRYGPDDLKLAEELGRRASVAVETARLFRENGEARARLESQEQDLATQLAELRARARDLEENRAELELSARELKETNEALLERSMEAERARERVRASEVSYRSLFDSLTDLICVVDLDGNLINVNEAVIERFGYRREEILGAPPRILTSGDPLVIAQISQNLQRAIQGHSQRFEYLARTKSGELFPKEEIVTRGEYFGAPVVICVGRDMTERRAAEDALARSEEQLRQIAENIREVFWVFDPDFSQTIYVSPAFEEIWGRPLETLYADARAFVENVHPDDAQSVIAAMRGARNGIPVRIEFRVIRPDGTVRWTWARGFPVYDRNGEIYRVVGTTEDITDRKRAEMERSAAESHYRRLVQLAPYGIFVADPDGHLIELNSAGAEILGLGAEFLIGRFLSDVLDPAHSTRAIRAFKEVAAHHTEHVSLELRIIRPSGESRLLDVILAPIQEDDGRISGVHGTARDITMEREGEKESRLLATALEKLDEGVSIERLDGQIIYANSTHARLYGYDREHSSLPNSSIFVPNPEEAARMAEMFQAISDGGTWVGRVRHARIGDGRVIPLELIAGRVDREDGESVLFNIARDISGVLQQEHQLRRVERLASVGTMIGGVAHELNNPLHAIRNFAEILLFDDREAEDFEALEIIRREADRAAKVVSDLRLFARQTQDEITVGGPVDLNDVVRHVLKLRRYSLETRNVVVVEELTDDLEPVLGSRSELEQVLINLVVNAEQAMAAESRERRLVLRTRACDKGAAVEVIDTGAGISAEDLERIFDPFWTTKAPGEGTGLGLSLVHSIIHEHRGEIRVESEPGAGTTFVIELPAALEPSGAAGEDGAMSPRAAARSLRVLVVDDEESLRRSAERYLTRIGHTVDTAEDGREALKLLERSSYDVILSDLRMPGIDGEALLQRLKELGTGLDRKVVFITGDAANAQAARLLTGAGVPVLVKPVRLERIGRAVEQVGQANEPQPAGLE